MRRPRTAEAPPPAPTLARIHAAGWRIIVHCEACRTLHAVNVEKVEAGRGWRRPIDEFRFLCPTCGAQGAAWVEAPSARPTGQARIWPPLKS